VSAVNWIGGEPVELSHPPHRVELLVKLRHGPSLVPAFIERCGSSAYSVRLRNKDKGIAPGQFAAFYSLRKIYSDGKGTVGDDMLMH